MQVNKRNAKEANLSHKDFAKNNRGLAPRKEEKVFSIVENFDEEESGELENGQGVKTFLKEKRKNYKPKDIEKYKKEKSRTESGGDYLNSKATENKKNSNKLFDILFENERIMIINKPVGIMVHPDDRSDEVAISDIAYHDYPSMREVGEGDRFGIVHRLDRDTSGVLILCKTQDNFKSMKTLFQNHKVRKVYRAIVEGNIREDTGVIDAPLARARSDFRKKTTVDMFSKDFRGKEREAITRYKVLARSEDKKFTYVELYPLTGRTHQLRVHMRSIRHPIIGDELYGSKDSLELASRCMLHAYKLEFTLRKEEIKVEAPIPDDMEERLEKYFGEKK